MALQVQFSALQRDPGLETFAQEMQVRMVRSVGEGGEDGEDHER